MWPAAVVLVGCGNMGGALLRGWLDRGLFPAAITIVEPEITRASTAADRGVFVVADPAEVTCRDPDVVVLAVKPQQLDPIARGYARFAAAGAVVLSIAAGKTLRALTGLLGEGAAIVRAMPNTPAAVRRGVSVACANSATDPRQRELCGQLLASVGTVEWIDDESLMDAVTALSGSGPAYLFLMVECLARAGIDAGLPAELAQRLARQTVTGSSELLDRSGAAPEVLRRNVTSPGGTTAAALKVLMAEGEGLAPLLRRALEAAKKRSRELAA